MRSEQRETTDPDLVRRRLDAVLGGGRADDPDDLDADDVHADDHGAADGRRDGRGLAAARGRHRDGGRSRDRRDGDDRDDGDDADLLEGLGLWPQLLGAVADRVPAPLRAGRWRASAPAAVAALVLAAGVVLVLAVRATAGAPGLPVPVRATAVAGATATAGASATAGTSGAPGAPGGAVVPDGTSTAPAGTGGAVPAPVGGPAVGAGADPGAVAGAGTATSPSAVPTPSPTAAVVVVHVVGQVGAPGVVRLPAGSRVAEAVAAAGGAGGGADLTRLNLARVLVDGEQVLVPAPGEELPPATAGAAPAAPPVAGGATVGAPGGGAAAPGAAPVDLNTATLADLDALPGIGPVLAQRVLDVRAELGSFSTVEELGEVSGIGEARLADLRDRVVVG